MYHQPLCCLAEISAEHSFPLHYRLTAYTKLHKLTVPWSHQTSFLSLWRVKPQKPCGSALLGAGELRFRVWERDMTWEKGSGELFGHQMSNHNHTQETVFDLTTMLDNVGLTKLDPSDPWE